MFLCAPGAEIVERLRRWWAVSDCNDREELHFRIDHSLPVLSKSVTSLFSGP
jgi:hypothetical protein